VGSFSIIIFCPGGLLLFYKKHLHRDSKGRGGKAVTLVKKLILSEDDMKDLAKKLRQVCGSGGTVKDGMIEIQGEHREKIAETLKKMGYKVKIAGG
jgi:translation initiation factor 1